VRRHRRAALVVYKAGCRCDKLIHKQAMLFPADASHVHYRQVLSTMGQRSSLVYRIWWWWTHVPRRSFSQTLDLKRRLFLNYINSFTGRRISY